MAKLPSIEKAKQVGKNLIVVIAGEEPITVTGDKETLAPIKALVEAYKAKPTAKGLKDLKTSLKPVTTAKAVVKEEKKKVVKETIKKVSGKSTKTKEKVNLVKELQSQMVDGELSEKDAEAMRVLLKKSDEAKNTATKATTTAPGRASRREH